MDVERAKREAVAIAADGDKSGRAPSMIIAAYEAALAERGFVVLPVEATEEMVNASADEAESARLREALEKAQRRMMALSRVDGFARSDVEDEMDARRAYAANALQEIDAALSASKGAAE